MLYSTSRVDPAVAENFKIEAWPEGRQQQGCPSKNCERWAEFLTSWEYQRRWYGGMGHYLVPSRMTRAACRYHVEKFAAKHGLTLPDNPLPEKAA
jgi:hypothetical protein